MQDARLIAIRQRQAIQQAAAEAQARTAARRAASVQPIETAVAAVQAAPEAETAETPAPAKAAAGPYTVRKGDTLIKLARERDLSVAQVMAWNGLASENVVRGQRLVFQALADEADEPLPKTSGKQTKGAARAVVAASRHALDARSADAKQVHLVQPGDTLFNISRRFGVSV